MRKAKKTKNKTKQKVDVRSLDMLIVCSYNTDYRRLKQENLVQVPCPCGCWQHQLILLILIRYKVVNYFMMSCRKYPYLPYRRDFSKTSSAPLEIPIKFPLKIILTPPPIFASVEGGWIFSGTERYPNPPQEGECSGSY